MAFLLMQKIAVMFLMMAGGYVLVKTRLLGTGESRALSVYSIFLVQPCVILRSFQIDFTPEVRKGFLLAAGAALLAHFLLLLFNEITKRVFRLDSIEQASSIYPNSGNLVIPLVMSLLGDEWVIYASAFMCIQLCFLWTHCVSLISGDRSFHWKKILLNCNVLAVLAGVILLLTGLRLPGVINEAMADLSATLGPVNMVMIGMLIAASNLKKIVLNPRIWLVCALRLLILPFLILLVFCILRPDHLADNGETILYISFMAIMSPVASMVPQLSQLHRKKPEFAGAINAFSTLMCIATMPVMTWIYDLLMR